MSFEYHMEKKFDLYFEYSKESNELSSRFDVYSEGSNGDKSTHIQVVSFGDTEYIDSRSLAELLVLLRYA